MRQDHLSRRAFLAGTAATTLTVVSGGLAPGLAQSGDSVVAMTFPGIWEQAARSIIVPNFKKVSQANLTVSPALIVDVLAKSPQPRKTRLMT